MKNCLQKYCIKILFFTFCTLVLIAVVISLALNIFLSIFKGEIEQNLNRHLNQKITVGSIDYFPPNFIIVKNISVFQDVSHEGIALLSLKKAKLTVSLAEFLKKRNFVITTMLFEKPVIDYSECVRFLKKNAEKIIAFLKSLSRAKTFNLTIKRALLNLSQEKGINRIFFDVSLNAKDGSISNIGSFDLGAYSSTDGKNIKLSLKGEPLRYKLKGHSTGESFVIESLEVEREIFYSKLWGATEENRLKLNGFLSLTGFFRIDARNKTFFSLIDRLKRVLSPSKKISMLLGGASAHSLSIYDLECKLELIPKGIQIESLAFSVNNIPFCLKGTVLFVEETLLNLHFSSFPEQPEEARSNNFRRFDSSVAGVFQGGKFNGKVDFSFLKKTKDENSLRKVEARINNLSFSYAYGIEGKLSFEKADFSCRTVAGTRSILLENFIVLSDLRDKRFKFVEFSSDVYDGFLEGNTVIDTAQFPIRHVSDIKIKNVSAVRLGTLSELFYKISGNLSCQACYRNYPHPNLNGEAAIYEGCLDNISFFKWLADFFKIPVLKKINFSKLSTRFILNEDIISLNSINLESNAVTLNGYFDLYADDLISSRISLALSTELLKTSPKFRFLLRVIDKHIRFLPFDFQLSGLFQAMNFKWLNSEFKRKIQEMIPDFIERGLEKKLENSIGVISERIGDKSEDIEKIEDKNRDIQR